MTEPVDFTVVGNLRTLRQPSENSCWATVATILESWRIGEDISIEEMLTSINEGFLSIFQSDTGLENPDLPDFLLAMGLVAEPPMSLGAQGIADLLSSHGPLWVTADEDSSEQFSIHARVVIGIKGDGSPQKTIATVIDPNQDSPIFETVEVLQEKFTQLAIGDMQHGGDLAKYIHF